MAKFDDSMNRTLDLREDVPSDLKPLFDHLINLAKDSHKRGYFKRAGRELLHARRLAGHDLRRSKVRRHRKAGY